LYLLDDAQWTEVRPGGNDGVMRGRSGLASLAKYPFMTWIQVTPYDLEP